MNRSLKLQNIIVVFLLLGLTIVSACNNNEEATITEIGHGVSSNFSNSKLYKVFGNQSDFEAAYNLTSLAEFAAPVLNFTTETVIGLFMGEQSTAGFEISASSSKSSNSHLTIFVNKTATGENCNEAQVLTQPFQFIRISGTYSTVSFEENEIIKNCTDTAQNQNGERQFTELKSGDSSPQISRLLQVYSSKEAFTNAYAFNVNDKNNIPTIDFSTNKVVGLFMGEYTTGGFSIEVAKMSNNTNYTLLDVTLNTLGPDCAADDAFNQPFQFIQFSDPKNSILFKETVVVKECDTAIRPGKSSEIGFTIIREGNVSQYASDRLVKVFIDQESFEHAYNNSGSEVNPPTAPIIDFTNVTVIGLFMEKLTTIGQEQIRVDSITQNNLATTVNVTLKKLKSGCPADAAESQPYQFISFPKSELPILFSESFTMHNCN